MENLPKNVINKIMLYLSTPTAEIVKEADICKFMALRLEKHFRGSAFDCGVVDSEHEHRFFLPRTFGIYEAGQRSTTYTLSEEEYTEYTAAYTHYVRYVPGPHIGPRDIYPTWNIKGNTIRWLEFEGDECYPSSYTDSDSDSQWEPDTDDMETDEEEEMETETTTIAEHEMT